MILRAVPEESSYFLLTFFYNSINSFTLIFEAGSQDQGAKDSELGK